MTPQWIATLQEILLQMAQCNPNMEQKRFIGLLSNLAFQMAQNSLPWATTDVRSFFSQEAMYTTLIEIIINRKAVAVQSDSTGGNKFTLTIIWKTEEQSLVSRPVPDDYLEDLEEDLQDLS